MSGGCLTAALTGRWTSTSPGCAGSWGKPRSGRVTSTPYVAWGSNSAAPHETAHHLPRDRDQFARAGLVPVAAGDRAADAGGRPRGYRRDDPGPRDDPAGGHVAHEKPPAGGRPDERR